MASCSSIHCLEKDRKVVAANEAQQCLPPLLELCSILLPPIPDQDSPEETSGEARSSGSTRREALVRQEGLMPLAKGRLKKP
jgi:hypothetical protein